MHKYIVLVSPSYGGAEKRFFDVFTALLHRGEEVSMIAPSILIDRLRQDHADRPEVLASLISVPLEVWSPLTFIRNFRVVLKGLPRGGHFHYPLNCLWPLHVHRGDAVTMTVADCTSVPSPFSRKRTSRWAWLNFFFVSRIDVLSPSIYAALRKHLRFQRMSVTPGGTYIVPPPHVPGVRKPIVVFFGRLVPGKGLPELFSILGAIWLQLRDRVPMEFSFQIAGYGELESYVVARVAELKLAGVPISFVGYRVANELLSRSAVLLSLQEPTNYPSRVVAESLMAGCEVIVRDTGDSRLFGTDLPGLRYCVARLDAGELADLIAVSISELLGDTGFEARVREGAMARFSAPAYIDYFQSLTSGESGCH